MAKKNTHRWPEALYSLNIEFLKYALWWTELKANSLKMSPVVFVEVICPVYQHLLRNIYFFLQFLL